ncbi:low-specificity L-threonine aldolase [Lysobacter sp. LF1]|uniref:Low-specificity L-threonine aldolase n=1 Tax=Lysobacter stagni TaxID=3045172 RepID=A0ABT6XDM5_9GAMM|nr:low-specificity L-threonine aldolase [Lysobacter sp. LF1]MDI9238245.1 low-specificity L-threonine aldolase [Lysobacter sp. LF1]
MHWTDLRSDTVTQPTAAMRETMVRAPVGDDVYGEDPSVNALQARLASDLGFEAGLFVPSGTQSNLIGLMAHCQRGDEYIVGMDAHTYKYEGGGAAVLGSIQPQPIVHAPDGTLPLDAVERAIKPIDPHFARTRLLCLENTWHGRALPLDYLAQARELCDRRGLSLHLDGARMFNAAVALRVAPREITQHFDSVSVCLSKGLGAPVGSVLLGTRALIETATRWRKVVGGGMRQAGMLAAAASYALDHHVARLADDHARAARIAEGLQGAEGVHVVAQHTNMVFIEVPLERHDALRRAMDAAHVRLSIGYTQAIRLVTHLDIDDEGAARVVRALRSFAAGGESAPT